MASVTKILLLSALAVCRGFVLQLAGLSGRFPVSQGSAKSGSEEEVAAGRCRSSAYRFVVAIATRSLSRENPAEIMW